MATDLTILFFEILIIGLQFLPLSCIFKTHRLSRICSHGQKFAIIKRNRNEDLLFFLLLLLLLVHLLIFFPSSLTLWAVGVLQAEAGLVALGHLGPIEGHQVVMGKYLDAMEVSAGGKPGKHDQ